MDSPSRRDFLVTSTASALVLGAPAVQARGANEKLNIGLIGSGNRGRTLAIECFKAGQNLVAIADVAQFRLDWVTAQLATAGLKEKPTPYRDYRKLLEHPGLDAVIIATPDHHHKDCLLAAMEAGKHAYIEKPLSHSIDEGKEMIAAVRKAKKVVQVGNQRHSGEHWARCREVIQSKDFGDLVWVKVWDCRNWVKRDPYAVPKTFDESQQRGVNWEAFLGRAKKQPFDPVRYWAWRWYWDFAGGLMTDIGAHQLDIVQWLGGVAAPKSVVAHGGVYHFKYWETPDVIHGIWDYGRFTATFAVEFINGFDGVGATFYGTKQTLHCDADAGGTIKLFDTIDKFNPTLKPKAEWKVVNETPLHVQNWLNAIKDNKDPSSPIELGHQVITAAHLANISYRTGQRVVWDAEKERIVG
ncbi:MAG: Gfo/Idh/MocA family oxidoreductase [Gemmataceae bacterium]|nr:Gfo/Idh/MocA family oxidoreductase [Gemmata sp.]MDW8196495.1 Gfo/Idh/MocA family oxidoreductase [Gemmataceae bacterium]